jgi:aspartate racemase
MSQTQENVVRRKAAGRAEAPAGANGHTPALGGPVPLSAFQRRLWQLDQSGACSPAHHVFRALRLEGALDVSALGPALQEVVRRHDSLRATFPGLSMHGPLQRIALSLTLDLPLSDLEPLPSGARLAEARRLADTLARSPFDLARGPVARARLVRIGEREHVLLLAAHRVAADDESLDLVLRELAAFYSAARRGEVAPALEPATPYAKLAAREEAWLKDEAGATQLAYWKQRLTGAPPALELPLDRPRPAARAYRGAEVALHLPESLVRELEAAGRREGAELSLVLLTAFQALLYRYTQQDDLVVGLPVSGRDQPGAERAVGPLVNLLPLRTDLSDNPTFRELLGRVDDVVRDARAREEFPFARLLDELTPQADPGRASLVQVTFELREEAPAVPEFAGLTATPFATDPGGECDLSVVVAPEAGGLAVRFRYDADLFDADTVGRQAGHFRTLLEDVAANPGRHLASLPLLTEAERHQIQVAWNDTQTDDPRELNVAGMFEAQVERTPEAMALVFQGEQLTYRELNRRANQLAHHLRGLGVGPDVLVGICADRSVEMVVGLLGVLKAGGAYVPLDPSYPKERIAFMVADARITVLLTQQHLVAELPPSEARVVRLDADWEAIARHAADNPVSEAKPDDLAYVIYTSGSTGKPKGVQVVRWAVANFLLSMAREPGLTARDTLLAVTTLSFDIAGLELYLPLTVGARLVVVPREVAVDPARLMEELTASGATVMQATPATWRLLLDGGWEGNPGLTVLCGGEAMAPDLAEKLLARVGSLWNVYGPTETTIWSTVHHVRKAGVTIPIGKPIANTQVYVLDAERQPVPAGVVGELYIGGDGMARGYLRRPELTAEKFVADPFRAGPGARLFRTGDLARWLPTGELECLGRIDHQVKVRGFRIELGEVESALLKHPVVSKAVVVAREDSPGQRRLVGYVVPAAGEAPAGGDLRRFVKERLPEYMVPSVVVVLDALPLTPNGKVDRRALPAPAEGRQDQDQAYVAPRDPLELELTQIWEATLGVRPIGVQDNFFDLGVDSLRAAGLFARLQKRFGKDLPTGALFRAPTVERLAALLRRSETREVWTSLVPIQPDGSRPPVFCIHGGAGTILIFHDLARHLGREQPLYALQAQGLYGQERPLTRVEDMAAHYLHEIRSVQPRGPYRLVGFCSFGVSIALEMAHRLRERGEEVALVAGLNSPLPSYLDRKRAEVDAPGLRARAGRPKERERARGVRAKVASLLRAAQRGLAWRLQHLGERLRKAQYRYYVVLRKPVPDGVRRRFFGDLHNQAEAQYQLRPYPGRLVIFHAKGLYPDPDLGWAGMVEDLEVHEIPGHHRDHRDLMAEPHIQALAERMKPCLE